MGKIDTTVSLVSIDKVLNAKKQENYAKDYLEFEFLVIGCL